MITHPVDKRLKSFPVSVVKATATHYNKAFHSKVFTLFASSESEVFTFGLRHKPHYDFCFGFMKNDECQWYLDIGGISKVREWVIGQCRANPAAVFRLYDEWDLDWQEYLRLAGEPESLERLSDSVLYMKFKAFYNQYLRVGSTAYIADSFMSTGTEDWLEKILSDELRKKGLKDDKNVRAVRKLTSPVHFSFTLEAERQLLIIAHNLIRRYPTKLPGFRDIKDSSDLREMEGKFHWIQNNYYNVHRISAEEFYQQAKEIIFEAENGAQIRRIIVEKESHLEQIKRERQDLIDSLGLSEFARNPLQVARLFAKWKDIRKSGVYIGMYYFDEFLGEISRRANISKSDLNYLVFDEIEDVLMRKNEMQDRIEARKEQCFFAVTPKGYCIAGGKDADEYFRHLPEAADQNVTQIRGVVASPGYAVGRVRIIRKTHEMAQFRTGEILVANQTTPEFVPIMKKAAAIITEQGGITSHAAIVSREMKKPCIIGTRIATTALLNGEVVEVDAHRGIVRKAR
ncbi:MAG: PEP-utilizing enzyme [archaeon]